MNIQFAPTQNKFKNSFYRADDAPMDIEPTNSDTWVQNLENSIVPPRKRQFTETQLPTAPTNSRAPSTGPSNFASTQNGPSLGLGSAFLFSPPSIDSYADENDAMEIDTIKPGVRTQDQQPISPNAAIRVHRRRQREKVLTGREESGSSSMSLMPLPRGQRRGSATEQSCPPRSQGPSSASEDDSRSSPSRGDSDDESNDERRLMRFGAEKRENVASWFGVSHDQLRAHRDIPLIASGYLQLFFNLFMVSIVLFIVTQVILTIRQDVHMKVQEYSAAEIINGFTDHISVKTMVRRWKGKDFYWIDKNDTEHVPTNTLSTQACLFRLVLFLMIIFFLTLFFGTLFISNFAFGTYRRNRSQQLSIMYGHGGGGSAGNTPNGPQFQPDHPGNGGYFRNDFARMPEELYRSTPSRKLRLAWHRAAPSSAKHNRRRLTPGH
ncbi:hypothetical protein EV182_001586 [Spiromyces aspiralis]|uniref:Uncharacterized protein n=1 Tax=Spiromyces aspiralis TaxID=68401 RepID=A0ACC1HUE9_9FUNG|nr:hypothetical protein EV182_001586 [Spiromyces aspiralis]